MSIKGRPAQKGFYAQNWAAMSLFLQYITQADFRFIGFEGVKLEDFYLVFEDGRKIICESKHKDIHLSHIRDVLNKIIKNGQVIDGDEILIICKDVNKEAKGLIENFKYFKDDIKKKLKSRKHKYTDNHLKLLPQLKFWEIKDVDTAENVTKILMAKVLSYPEPFWVPEHELKKLTTSLVVEKVFKGSQKGEVLSKKDFLNELEKEKIRMLQEDGYDYEKEKRTDEKRIVELVNAIRSKTKKDWCNNEIKRIAANPSIHHFTLTKLETKNGLKLDDWENLWKATYQSAFSIELFKIFTNNIKTKENQEYALRFILETLGDTTNYFREEFIKYDIVKLCGDILDLNPTLDKAIFEVIKKVFEHSIDRFLYVQRRRDESWEREKTAELLEKLYDKTKNTTLRKSVISYILDNFNLVSDDGKFWHYTPPSIFKVIGKHVARDPKELIPWFTQKCTEQFNKFYKSFGKGLEFKGWEHMGGGISQSGSEFSISDRHFVTQIIAPALRTLYETKGNKQNAWKFIESNCITRDINKVSATKPDFLNRASIPVLVDEYRTGKNNKQALEILSDFIRMRRGIPWKNDLIFQAVNNDKFSDKQKWQLVKVSLKEFDNLPTNVFVEQITSGIAENSKVKTLQKEAIKVIESWAQNPKYNKRHGIGSFDIIDNVSKLLNNKKTFQKGVDILQKHLDNPQFIKKTDTFDTYDVSKAIAKAMETDDTEGLKLLESIYSYKDLSINQQIALCGGIYNVSDNFPDKLFLIFSEFLKPKLTELLGKDVDIDKLKDIKPVENKFDHRYSRETLVQFTEKLAKIPDEKYLEAALWLLKIFVLDSDPPKGKYDYKDDPKGDFDEHKRIVEGEDQLAIRTVRGWCCHVIQNLAVPRDPKISHWTGKFIEDLVLNKKYENTSLMRLLAFDDNYYVRLESCIPLEQIIRNRHTHLEGESERFISQKAAEEIEQILLDMVFNKENQKMKAVMKRIASVFTYVRTLGTDQVNKTLKVFLNSEFDEVSTEITPLLVFYALFRKSSFKNWPKAWKKPGKFDADKFTLFEDQLKKGKLPVRAQLAWQLGRLPDEIEKTPEEKRSITVSKAVKLSAKYLTKLADKYEHEVFDDIYRFVEEYMNNHFEDCYKLWKKCIKVESEYFEKNWSEDKLQEMYWWPFFYNGKVLTAILDNKGEREFLRWLKKLADYPEKILIANDLDDAVSKMIEIKDTRYQNNIKDIFTLLIKRNPKYYDSKQQWLKEIKNV